MLNLLYEGCLKKGKSLHKIKLKNNLPAGARINRIRFLFFKRAISLVKSLAASAKGWKIPIRDTLLGPLRNWAYPKIFRSNKVKKAMANIAIT